MSNLQPIVLTNVQFQTIYNELPQLELPGCPLMAFYTVVEKYENLFRTTPGVTEATYHFIPTTGNPVRVPPR